MGRKKISIEQLQAEVQNIVKEYADDVEQCLDLASTQYAKIAKRELQETSPARTGHYAKGWAYRKSNSKHKKGAIVHNASSYQLTHLLEHGHALRNGGRAKAIPHIKPVEEKISQDFVTEVKEKLSGN